MILVVVVFLGTATATTMLRDQNKNTAPPTQHQQIDDADQYDVPIADYAASASSADTAASEPVMSEERAKRQTKNKRHNLPDKSLSPEDVARFAIREDETKPPPPAPSPSLSAQKSTHKGGSHEIAPPVVGGAVTDHTPPEPALPTTISDAIVIGEVTEAQAALSEDRTSVYSEFKTRIEEVLKSGGGTPVTSDTFVTALRPGGGVRFPSGKVRRFGVEGRTLPRVSRRYLLFLKFDNLAQAFYIVTGYELRGGKVFPLDGIPRYGSENHPFAAYGKYKNADEATFLNDVRQAIINPPPQTSGGYSVGSE